MAAEIQRRAERDANRLRREAAEWASATRRDADRYRERVLGELEHTVAVAGQHPGPDEADPQSPETQPAEIQPAEIQPAGEPEPEVVVESVLDLRAAHGEVIDLREAAEARGTPMRPATDDSDDTDVTNDTNDTADTDEPVDDLAGETAVVTEPDAVEPGIGFHRAEHDQVVGGSYVVGHPLPPVETSLETKVHDVVRLAVRRTFHSNLP